jgi:hypothetical protein
MNRIITIIAFLCFSMGMKAQHETGSWTLTPHVGINSSNMSIEDLWTDADHAVSAKRKWGFVGGLDAEYLAWQQIGISVGAYYSNEGYTYGTLDNLGKVTQTLHFINIPVLVNFYIEPNILPGLALKTGVQLGYLVSGKYKDNVTSITNTSDFKRVNISIPAGISYCYRNFVADLRYNIGLMNLCNVELAVEDSWKTNSLWLTVGYQFKL